MTLVAIAFWAALAVVVYSYVGYPLLVWLCARRRSDAWVDAERRGLAYDVRNWPFVSIIIAAYKEERFILQRLQNCMLLDYPGDRFEVIVGCDGQEDNTGELVRAFGDSRIRLAQFPVRRGKASVLNDCVPLARGEILVFSDANTMMHPQALKALVRHFVQPDVGAVCGKLNLTDPVTGQNADGIYWKYENFIKRAEARLGALLGVNGGIYALRKALYRPLPPEVLSDDFLIGMRVHQQGFRLLYDATATAEEETPSTIGSEFGRRARLGAGGWQSLVWLRSLLHPRHGWLALAFWSHKAARWFAPLLLVVMLGANAALAARAPYSWFLVAQALFYTVAYGIPRMVAARFAWRPLRLPAMFVSMNAALAVGFWRWLRGIRGGTWVRTERQRVVHSSKTAGRPAEATAESEHELLEV